MIWNYERISIACLLLVWGCGGSNGSDNSNNGNSGGTSSDGGAGGDPSSTDSGGSGGTDSGGSGGTAGGSGGTAGATSTNTGGSGGTSGGSGGTSGGSGGTSGATSTGGSSGTGGGGTGGGPSGLVITVTPGEDQHPISPLIYGIDGAGPGLASGAKLVRLGGAGENESSGYNWEVNATHLGDLSSFTNAPFGEGTAPGSAVTELISTAQTNEGAAMFFVPMGPRVAADSTSGDVRDSVDYLTTRFRSSLAAKGSDFATDPDTADEFVYQDEFVNWAVTQAGSTPLVIALDDHPELWSDVQSLIFPDKADYDAVVDLGIEFATAIKEAAPNVEVTGPASYGWLGFTSLQDSPDYASKGDFLEYYLTSMAQAEDDQGYRLLDYVDVHWWSEVAVDGVRIIEPDAGSDIVAARLQAPRSLWDPTFDEGTWISGTAGGPIDLLHRLKAKIDDNYPGTKLALSAWDYGGEGHISGALAAADVLGILGREGVHLASVAAPSDSASYLTAAFQLYLNYDGSGAEFGDTSVRATTTDVVNTSAYASIDSTDSSALVIIVLNKSDTAQDATIRVVDDTVYSACSVFELDGDDAEVQSGPTLTPTTENTFEYAIPPFTAAVIVPQ